MTQAANLTHEAPSGTFDPLAVPNLPDVTQATEESLRAYIYLINEHEIKLDLIVTESLELIADAQKAFDRESATLKLMKGQNAPLDLIYCKQLKIADLRYDLNQAKKIHDHAKRMLKTAQNFRMSAQSVMKTLRP